MGQVVDIKKRESGFVKYLHRAGWEKGFKIKGKWNGYYENIGILPNTDITCYSKGNFNMGLRVGSWEITFIDHNRNNFTQVHTGRYLNGKKDGIWKILEFGKVAKEHLYKKGEFVDE